MQLTFRIKVVKRIKNIYPVFEVVVGDKVAHKHTVPLLAARYGALPIGMVYGGYLSPRK